MNITSIKKLQPTYSLLQFRQDGINFRFCSLLCFSNGLYGTPMPRLQQALSVGSKFKPLQIRGEFIHQFLGKDSLFSVIRYSGVYAQELFELFQTDFIRNSQPRISYDSKRLLE